MFNSSNNFRGFNIIAAFLLIVVLTACNEEAREPANTSDSTSTTSSNEKETTEAGGESDNGVEIPAIQLPEGSDMATADMIGLIVYQGNIYTQTNTEISPEDAKELVGEKLGRTTGTIDEWSEQEDYEKEFASSTGVGDVFAVKGYEPSFRIMMYGDDHAEFYEHLNGITVASGEDVFGKMNMTGNVVSAEYQFYSDWYQSRGNKKPIGDEEVVNTFVEDLNETKPLVRSESNDPIGDLRSDETHKKLYLTLEDGSRVQLTLLEGGYIYYGYGGVYFQMDEAQFSDMWELLE
ncbi:hypothetical protein [Thalassobacillus hwangdonensis]|uniref:Deacetylase PdaC domain-containing protein n=1 Tax=Thalassobacillus hwangdonensis TaxID=546108 RepID=A0ABW3L570_9BACI